MIELTKQESFKLLKKTGTWLSIGILISLQLLFGILAKSQPHIFNPQETFVDGYYGQTWMVLLIIAAAGAIVTMEFQYGTIKELLYRKYDRGQILISKLLTMILYSIGLFLLVTVVSFIIKFGLFPSVHLATNIGHGYTVLSSTLIVGTANLITYWLIMSLVLMLSTLFKSSGLAVSIGMFMYLISTLLSSIFGLLIQKWDWFKWNPLNMLNYPAQMITPSLHATTQLTLTQLLLGNIGYTFIFLGIGYLIFKHRSI